MFGASVGTVTGPSEVRVKEPKILVVARIAMIQTGVLQAIFSTESRQRRPRRIRSRGIKSSNRTR